MALPLFDSIALPPDSTLVDVNTVADDVEREGYQALALEHWIEETEGASLLDFVEREWDDNEGIFIVVDDASGDVIGVAIILDVEGT